MIANTYHDKAISNFRTAKILYSFAKEDEEQLNIIGYHLQQAIELAIKHALAMAGIPFQKTHDLDQLISIAKSNGIDLQLPEYILDRADVITLWESKTRYTMGFKVEVQRIEKTIEALEQYFSLLKANEMH